VAEIKKRLPGVEEEKVGSLSAGPPKVLPRGGMMPFALLSRKGKYTKLDRVELPAASSIVAQTRQRILEEQSARSEVKEQTMQQIQQDGDTSQSDQMSVSSAPGSSP